MYFFFVGLITGVDIRSTNRKVACGGIASKVDGVSKDRISNYIFVSYGGVGANYASDHFTMRPDA
jgi:hypothetical protein